MACDPCLQDILDANPALKDAMNGVLDDIATGIDFSFITGKIESLETHLLKLKKEKADAEANVALFNGVKADLELARDNAGLGSSCPQLNNVLNCIGAISAFLNLAVVLDIGLGKEILELELVLIPLRPLKSAFDLQRQLALSLKCE